MTTDTVKISGIKYEVVVGKTAEQVDSEGLHNVARIMRTNSVKRQLVLKRPAGAKFYFANEFEGKHGISYSKPFSL